MSEDRLDGALGSRCPTGAPDSGWTEVRCGEGWAPGVAGGGGVGAPHAHPASRPTPASCPPHPFAYTTDVPSPALGASAASSCPEDPSSPDDDHARAASRGVPATTAATPPNASDPLDPPLGVRPGQLPRSPARRSPRPVRRARPTPWRRPPFGQTSMITTDGFGINATRRRAPSYVRTAETGAKRPGPGPGMLLSVLGR